MPVYEYTGHYDRYIEGIGAVKTGDLVPFLEISPGFEWIEIDASPKVPESPAEPVAEPPASNETPEIPKAPEPVPAAITVADPAAFTASPSVAAVVH